jgi:hypothetical protein
MIGATGLKDSSEITPEESMAEEVLLSASSAYLTDYALNSDVYGPTVFFERKGLKSTHLEDTGKVVYSGVKMQILDNQPILGFSPASEGDVFLHLACPVLNENRTGQITYGLLVPVEKADELRQNLEEGKIAPTVIYEIARLFHKLYGPAKLGRAEAKLKSPTILHLQPNLLYPHPDKLVFAKDCDPNKIVQFIRPFPKENSGGNLPSAKFYRNEVK